VTPRSTGTPREAIARSQPRSDRNLACLSTVLPLTTQFSGIQGCRSSASPTVRGARGSPFLWHSSCAQYTVGTVGSADVVPLEIDQHDVRVVAQTVEDDPLSVGGHVERAHRIALFQPRERTGRQRGQIETLEVLRSQFALHVNQGLAIGREPNAFAVAAQLDRRQLNGSSVGSDGEQRLVRRDVWSGVRNRPAADPRGGSSGGLPP
jgi:hypothetical protein